MAASVNPEPGRSRRSFIRAGLAGLAGLAVGAFGRPASAKAAAGTALIVGQGNSAGTANTSLTTSTNTGTAFLVTQNGTATALRGIAGNGIAGFFTSANGSGVSGVVANKDRFAVYAANDATTDGSGAALRANGKANNGIYASSNGYQRVALWAVNTYPSGSTALWVGSAGFNGGEIETAYLPAAASFVGTSGINVLARDSGSYPDGCAVTALAEGTVGVAVYAEALASTGDVRGVRGITSSPTGVGVEGTSWSGTGATHGVFGSCQSASSSAAGVEGTASGANARGVAGVATGVGGVGVFGVATASSGVGYGVFGQANPGSGYSLFGNGRAGVFGNLDVSGNLTKAGGTFKIDHPLDPANRFLYHSFVESPDMKNVYDGVVTLDKKGEATVELPDWFGALNRDVRYQLTAIGAGAPELHVKSEVSDGRFSIGGGLPGRRVSWQLTGIRRDAWAEAHRSPVEELKSKDERGLYLHPVEHGQEEAKGIDAARHGTPTVVEPATLRDVRRRRR